MEVLDICDKFKNVTEDFTIGKSNYWILIDEKEIEGVKDILNIGKKQLEECLNVFQPSKINFFDGCIFISTSVLDYINRVVDSKNLNIFFGKNFIVTAYRCKKNYLTDFIENLKKTQNSFMIKDKPETYILLYYILDRIIVNDYDVISELEAQTDRIEISILKNAKREHIDELIRLRREVYKLKKYLNPLRYIGDSIISNDNLLIEKENLKYFYNLNNKIEKLMISLEGLVQDLAMVREAFEAESANKTNELMKMFTLITSIFLPLNLITSIFGMELGSVPLKYDEKGFIYICIIMALVTIYLIYLFKRKKWL